MATYTSVEPTGNLPVGGTTNLTVNGGELKGLFDTRDNMLSEYRTQLDNFASNLITEINNLHMGGYDLNGDAGIEFFTGTDASDIQVNSSIEDDVMLVAPPVILPKFLVTAQTLWQLAT